MVQVRQGETLWRVAGLGPAGPGEVPLEQSPGIEISRSLLKVYGGRVWVEPGAAGQRDLCFTIPMGKPPVIMIIDDDADTVRLYQAYLQTRDYVVRTARNAAQLRAQLAEEMPDLILLDVLMPREDGWDILRYLKGSPATADIPVVICSVLSQPALALSLGAAEVLRKPISEEILLKTIDRLLRQRDNPD